MSLTVDGVWKAGVWAPTVWAAGVWYEPSVVVQEEIGGISKRSGPSAANALIKWIKKEKQKEHPFESVDKQELVNRLKEAKILVEQEAAARVALQKQQEEEEVEALLFIMVNLDL